MAGITRTATANMPDAGNRITRVATANMPPLVTDVPQSEADALMYLYNNGGGAGWTNKTGWGTDLVVGNWYGITVSGGHVTKIILRNNNGFGDISSFPIQNLPYVGEFEIKLNNFSGDISGWDVSNLWDLWFLDNNFSGDISGWILPSSVVWIGLSNNQLTGVPVVEFSAALQLYYYDDNNLSQSDVDSIIDNIWDYRAEYTYSVLKLFLGGTNATPSGIYQDGGATPSTGLEKIHDLINDDNAEGFQTW